MKARSPAQQTFVLQLTNGCGMYLPTALAIEGGSYSGLPHVNKVGPEGGQILVDQSGAGLAGAVSGGQALTLLNLGTELFSVARIRLPALPSVSRARDYCHE